MPVGNSATATRPGSRLRELGLVLPKPPTPLGAYVEVSKVGSPLFLSGTLPLVDGRLAISGRLGANLSVDQGREAARLASLNALAAAQEHVGDLNRLKKLVKLSVLLLTTEEFVEHAAVADGASNLFVQLFGAQAGHVRRGTHLGCRTLRTGFEAEGNHSSHAGLHGKAGTEAVVSANRRLRERASRPNPMITRGTIWQNMWSIL
jgi:enamine deaminase RidA (YjgF/YER057c/UK114 family)